LGSQAAALAFAPAEAAWEPTRAALDRALCMTNNSAACPDGIPYVAWRTLGRLGSDVLWDVLQALLAGQAEDMLQHYPDYNTGMPVCLPKKSSRTDAQGRPVYEPSQTRPLSLVNCDNRVVANAFRLTWEPILDDRVTHKQRGFIRGRSLLANVCDVEDQMRKILLAGTGGATLLLDFASAFPSVSRSYLLSTLAASGLPRRALNAARLLYTATQAEVSLGGTRHGRFSMSAGIRQGCPLSPLLFATCTDEILRELQDLEDTDAYAFADDTAVTTACWTTQGTPSWPCCGSIQHVAA
jgi:hypothetical protein